MRHRVSIHITILLLVLTAGVISTPGLAQERATENDSEQRHTFIFKGEPIESALQQLVQKTEIDLIYDPLIMPDHTVFKTAKDKKPEAVLRLILTGSGLDFIQLSSGTYVVTRGPQKEPEHGNLSGRVMDKQTGEPLPGANVMLAAAGAGTATSEGGYFNIPRLKNGYHEVTITYVGYKPVRDTVWIPGNATASVDISLSSQPVVVEPLVVQGIQKRLPAAYSLVSQLDGSEITESTRYGTADAIKSLDAVTGIDVSLPMADLSMQGGGQGDHQLQLDGVPVYSPMSMGRMMGAFSPWAVRRITVNKAGFDATKGSQLSGFINIEQDVNNAANNTLMVQGNPMNLNARYDMNTEPEEGPAVNLMVAGRFNIWDWYQEPALQNTLRQWDQLDPVLTLHLFQNAPDETIYRARDHNYDIRYFDLHTAAEIKHNRFHTTRISAYYGKNHLQTNLFTENLQITQTNSDLYYSIDRYDWRNAMAKIAHDWVINSRLDMQISSYISNHNFDHRYILTDNYRAGVETNSESFADAQALLAEHAAQTLDTGNSNALIESVAEMDLSYSITKNITIRSGLQARHFDYSFKLSDQFYNMTDSNSNSFLLSGYLHNELLLTDRTSLTLGNRFTFIPSRDLVFAEPRFSVKHDAPDTGIGYLSGQLSGGIYRQFMNQFDVSNVGPSSLVPSLRFWVPADYTTTIPKAYHLAFDALWEPSKRWQVRLETYYKWIPSRLDLDYEVLSGFPISGSTTLNAEQNNFITESKGYAYGASLSLNKHLSALNMQLETKYQYGVARQRTPSRFSNTYQPLPASQPHTFNAGINWNIMKNTTFLLEWKSIWGRSWAFRKAYYDYLSLRETPSVGSYNLNTPGNDRLSRYSSLNTSISYNLELGGPDLLFRVDIYNLLDHENVTEWWLSPYRSSDGALRYRKMKRTTAGFRPSFSIKISL